VPLNSRAPKLLSWQGSPRLGPVLVMNTPQFVKTLSKLQNKLLHKSACKICQNLKLKTHRSYSMRPEITRVLIPLRVVNSRALSIGMYVNWHTLRNLLEKLTGQFLHSDLKSWSVTEAPLWDGLSSHQGMRSETIIGWLCKNTLDIQGFLRNGSTSIFRWLLFDSQIFS
jgi:hypothetical protein